MNHAFLTKMRRLMLPVALVCAASVLVAPPGNAAESRTAVQASCRTMRVVAHRGFHRRHTENTIGAFRAAAHRGADGIETDLRTTGNGHVVLVHDRTLRRTTRSRGIVHRMTGREVHRARTNDGEHVPFVRQATRFLHHHDRMRGVFEMKSMTRRSMHRLRHAIVTSHVVRRVTLTSKRRSYLRRAKHLMPNVHRMRITWKPVRPRRARHYVTGVMMPLKRLSHRRVSAYRRHGLAVGAMTVDHPGSWRRMARLRVGTVSTNRVRRFHLYCRRAGR